MKWLQDHTNFQLIDIVQTANPKLVGQTLSSPVNFSGNNILLRAAARQIFWTRPKTAVRPPDFEKTILHVFLKATYPQMSYWVHFIFKVSNLIYMFTSIEKIKN